jgi:hypothetical protein
MNNDQFTLTRNSQNANWFGPIERMWKFSSVFPVPVMNLKRLSRCGSRNDVWRSIRRAQINWAKSAGIAVSWSPTYTSLVWNRIFLGPVLGFRTERNSGFNIPHRAYIYSKWVCESLTSQKRISASSSMVEGWIGSLMSRRPSAFSKRIYNHFLIINNILEKDKILVVLM